MSDFAPDESTNSKTGRASTGVVADVALGREAELLVYPSPLALLRHGPRLAREPFPSQVPK